MRWPTSATPDSSSTSQKMEPMNPYNSQTTMGVDVHHAVDVEVQESEQEVRGEELPGRQQPEEHLRHEQGQRHHEILDGQPLSGTQRGVVHAAGAHASSAVKSPWGNTVNPDGKPFVSIADIHFR